MCHAFKLRRTLKFGDRRKWYARRISTVVLGLTTIWAISLRGELALAQSPPPGKNAERLSSEARRILGNVKSTKYSHTSQVDEEQGIYFLDCSGLACYALDRLFPRHFKAIALPEGQKRLCAVDFFRFFSELPADLSGGKGWQRVSSLLDARPGDIVAWKAEDPTPGNTGHVAILDSVPRRTEGGQIHVEVIDSTEYGHDNDTRKPPQTGVGRGAMWFTIDEKGQPTGYQWRNTRRKPLERPIAIGRVVDLPGETLGEVVAKVRTKLQSWHSFEEAWADEATMIFTASYLNTMLPCIQVAPGSYAMPMGSGFKVIDVLKGDVDFKSVIWWGSRLEGERFPHAVIKERKYLVLLRPGPRTLDLMRKPGKNDSRLVDFSDFVAIIDISQDKAESEAVRVQSTRSGEYEGFRFTPQKWASLRGSEQIDLEMQRQFVPFLQNVVLAEGATLAQVRSYLGAPDDHSVGAGGMTYHYKFNETKQSRDGLVSGELEVSFTSGLAMDGYKIEFARCNIKSSGGIDGISWTVFSQREHEQMGLPWVWKKTPAERNR